MDILIKNMELPPEGKQICLWVMHNGTVWHEVARDMIPTKMEAVALPEHHGRLGDLDLVEEWMRKKHKEHDCPFDIDAFLFALKKFPTIVEATE